MKFVSLLTMTALFSLVSCSHFSKSCCQYKEKCEKSESKDKKCGDSCNKKKETEMQADHCKKK